MASKIPPRPGEKVRQSTKPIEGTVKDIRWLPDDQHFQVEVAYVGPEGPTSRWFREDEVEVVEDADPEVQAATDAVKGS